jgi:putative transcription antitermination factor YqgF
LSVRVVGIDLGERRIGIAVSDSSGLLASPREVIVRSGDGNADRLAVVAAVRDAGGELVVVGLPVSLDGNEREPASAARREAEALVPLLDLPVARERTRGLAPAREGGRRAPPETVVDARAPHGRGGTAPSRSMPRLLP